MLKFLALQSKGSLILKPVSWGFVFCGIKSEQEPLAGNAQRFSYIEAMLLCLPTEKLEPKTNKAEKSVKDKQVDKTEKKARNARICSQCLRDALNGRESKSKATHFGVRTLDQDSRLLPTNFHSIDIQLTSHLKRLPTAETKSSHTAYKKC